MMREDEKAVHPQSDDSTARSSLSRLVVVIVIIFASELAVMWALPHLVSHPRSLWGAVLDAALLGLITGPFLWWLVVRPLDVVARFERTRATRIIEGANDAIITLDASGRIESANRAVETIFGRTARDARGRDISWLFPESAARVRAVLADGREASLRLREPHRDGRRLHLEADAFPVPMPGQTILAFV
ncbi:MAG TPA: PAS domain-containing protein, partial [Candidatus Eisenbacteria bacterium]|nr:PAS domain-containing protein [Candidatus Eisenbacteria bacterium]